MRVAFVIVAATIYLFVVAITATNWYEYRVADNATDAIEMMNQGWQVVYPEMNFSYLRRPRFHI